MMSSIDPLVIKKQTIKKVLETPLFDFWLGDDKNIVVYWSDLFHIISGDKWRIEKTFHNKKIVITLQLNSIQAMVDKVYTVYTFIKYEERYENDVLIEESRITYKVYKDTEKHLNFIKDKSRPRYDYFK